MYTRERKEVKRKLHSRWQNMVDCNDCSITSRSTFLMMIIKHTDRKTKMLLSHYKRIVDIENKVSTQSIEVYSTKNRHRQNCNAV
jgi:riboflavin synthase alpha subunit